MKLGVNAMSLMKAMHEDFDGCMQRLADGGCDYIEAMGDWGADPKMLEFYANLAGAPSGWSKENTLKRLAIIRKKGMDIIGTFIFDDYLDDEIQEMGQYYKDNGFIYAVLSFLHYEDLEDIYKKVENVKRWGQILHTYGVQLVIHNHEHDMALIVDKDGKEKTIVDIFLENTTPEELMVEADTGWLLYADVNPAEWIANNVDRIMILHFKDICKEYKEVDREEIFCACGEGAVDFKSILEAVPKDRKETMIYVLDQDKSKGDIIEDQVKSIQYIKGL